MTREQILEDFEGRHPATRQVLGHFAHAHLPDPLKHISAACCDLAMRMAHALPDGPELTTGLRKLLEAKDAFVRTEVDRPANPARA